MLLLFFRPHRFGQAPIPVEIITLMASVSTPQLLPAESQAYVTLAASTTTPILLPGSTV